MSGTSVGSWKKGYACQQFSICLHSIIRHVVEYVAAAWHSMLTLEQSDELERQPLKTLKNILGPGASARRMLKIEPLSVRRDRTVLKFAIKKQ